MTLAVVSSRALDGLGAPAVQVEVHMANGLPSFTLVGLADTEVKEARERVRSALIHSGLGFPHNQRITVNLAPADLPKESGRFDLPIALGILAASGHIPPDALDGYEFAGELSLAGELRPVRGALAMALAVQRQNQQPRQLVLPPLSAQEAALVEGIRVYQARHLQDVVSALGNGANPTPLTPAKPMKLQTTTALSALDLADVRGQQGAKRALEIAAAGNHSLLLVGSPGSGKSMLAQRLSSLLPPMNEEEALSSAALASVSASGFDVQQWRQRPMRSPHHSASSVALVGGGSPPRPGEISLAHGGVLFLDELPEFNRACLESLREPLETGRITLSRAARQASYPAQFQLIAAMNPCPCGWLGAQAVSGRVCRCTPDAVNRYQSRISGPLLDRMDLQVEVPAVKPSELLTAPAGEKSATVAQRVAAAQTRQRARQGKTNAELNAGDMDLYCPLDEAAQAFAMRAAERMGWSGRSLHRVIKVARTIADLAEQPTLNVHHLAEAMQYRRGLNSA